MRSLIIVITMVMAASVAFAQSPGCGPNPMGMIPTQQFNQPVVSPGQAAQQAKQIQMIQARADYQASIARIQTQQQISQIQNQGNPQLQKQNSAQFQAQIQQLQQNFSQMMQTLQR